MTAETALARSERLAGRARQFAVAAIRFSSLIRHGTAAEVIGRQLVRSATGAGANYRAAARSRSLKEFVARLAVAVEEADESAYWIELAVEADLVSHSDAAPVLDEARQLTAILGASLRTARSRLDGPSRRSTTD